MYSDKKNCTIFVYLSRNTNILLFPYIFSFGDKAVFASIHRVPVKISLPPPPSLSIYPSHYFANLSKIFYNPKPLSPPTPTPQKREIASSCVSVGAGKLASLQCRAQRGWKMSLFLQRWYFTALVLTGAKRTTILHTGQHTNMVTYIQHYFDFIKYALIFRL